MRYYPLLLNLSDVPCLVVGGGAVGLRKIQGLLPCQPREITVIDPALPGPELAVLLASHPNITYAQRPFAEVDIEGMRLVFACTSSRVINAEIGEACAARNILCNMADAPEDGAFILPASITRGDLSISVSTNGASPALARIIRQELEERYGPEYEVTLRLLGHIRTALLPLDLDVTANRDIFRDLAGALPELIRGGHCAHCRTLLKRLLPTVLHSRIGEWCDDCFPTV